MDSFDEFSDGSDFAPAAVSYYVPDPDPISRLIHHQKTKPKKAVMSKAAPKKPVKSLAKDSSKAKSVVPKKRSKNDSEDEDAMPERENMYDDESLLSSTPPNLPKAKKPKTASIVKPGPRKSLGEVVNENMNVDGATDKPKPKKTKRVSEQYQMLTQIEHIIKRPDTYIGSIERTEKQMWVYNTAQDMMEFREVSYVPGLYKIFDEILVNAADNKQNDKNMNEIHVTVDRQKGEISVFNNGRGIPIEMHSKEHIYIPEMVFGKLLSSSNYDDDQEKVTGGRNGYGAKLANIYSTKFIIETVDSRQKKKYQQTWTNNMANMEKAKITDCKGEDYTKVTFSPDFAKFGMTEMDDDFEAIAKRRVYDMAGTCKDVTVKLNGSRVPVRSFKKYMELYTKAIKKERGEEAADDPTEIITERPDPRWEIGFAVSDGTFQQVSFVNAIATTSGGTHVNYISDQICTKLADIVKKKNRGGASLKVNQIRNHIFLFINCLIVNPAFTSQTKEQLTTKASKFGSTCNISDAFIKKIQGTKVIENILHFAQQKADQILKKSDGSRRSRMTNPKLTDANKAGTKDGHMCTLILTEGDSAKGLAVAGRSVVGPDLFGVFPLRGKLLNVRDASIDQISKNQEIQNIKNFLGLQHKKIYTDTKGLRYGHLMIMTDQDHDGSHIKGLLINFLQVQFPSLLKIPGFLVEFITPIVKVWKGDPKRPTHSRAFFTMPEYLSWKESHKHEKGWDHKYYKGLGTSSTEEAQKYFNDIDKHHKEFATLKEEEEPLIDLAFSKKKADERKEWLRQFKPGGYLDHSAQKITYTDFVNKELILFSMADNVRSIPSVVDGLKPGQRKVLYSCFKRNLKKDLKVVELAGYVSGLTAYQHGETSLQQTITGLAQTFVGSNNVNCLEPSGNFGSRLQGGGDAASARYIYTRLSPFARKLFHSADDPLLTYNTDDDRQIEPEIYVPVLPLILINGADGIGTGWSTSIPNYNPIDIAENLKRMMNGEPCQPMQPWFRGYKGEISPLANDRFKFSGKIERTSDTEVQITELPIRVWTQDFKDRLEEIIKAEKIPSFIKDYKDYNTHQDVHFVIQLEEKHTKDLDQEALEERFKLSKTMTTTNLVAFDPEGRIHKYASVEEILQEFFSYRLKFYQKRKDWLLAELNRELKKFTNQMRFIQMIIDQKLVISKKRKAVLVAELQKLNFDPFPKSQDPSKAGEVEEVVEDEEESDGDQQVDANSYDYLLGMPLWSLTQERVERLRKQVGDKEIEIDELMKLRKEDLWTKDLDDFIDEWHLQLSEEKQRQRHIVKGRRNSKKFAIGGPAPAIKKKRGLGDALDDDDYEDSAPKPKKVAPSKQQATITKFVNLPKANPLLQRPKQFDGSSSDPETSEPASTLTSNDVFATKITSKPVTAASKQAPKKAVAPKLIELKEDVDIDLVPSRNKSRQQRNASKKAANYVVPSDSDDENGDDLLGDVSLMVKNLAPKIAPSTMESKPLFSSSFSRPSSSHGSRSQLKSTFKDVMDLSEDETDYQSLAPVQSSRRSLLVTHKEDADGNDSDDDVVLVQKPPTKPPVTSMSNQTKLKEKENPKPKKITSKNIGPKSKKEHQSPVAKAYAKRLAKKKVIDSDDEPDAMADAMADEILKSSDSEVEELRPRESSRPARRAVATRKAISYEVDDDDSSGFESLDASSGGYSEDE